MENDQELIKEVYPISILRESQQNKDEGECWISEDVIKKWTDNPQGVSPEYPYEFCCTRHYTYKNIDNPSEGKEWQPWDTKNISLWAHYGMNAIPYQLLLGNPYESIYQIEASGATREAYVIIDGDGISTGEIILQGGYENKDQKFNLKIDELSILDPISNKEHKFENSNYSSINLGDNWYCRFELSDNNGNPVIKIIGIGPNPESAVIPPSTIQLAPTDSCFKCDLGGKYQKKIIIQAKNKQKNITAAATWTVTAIRDKNGDGIWRYQIMPNIDRVVRNVYYKRIGEDPKDVQVIKDKWNVGDASELRFDIEKDSYGKSWTDITNQECRLCILSQDDTRNILYHKLAMGGPITIPFDAIETIMDQLRGDNLLFPTIKQYIVCLQVVDPDYKIDSIIGEGKWSTVDKCNLIFEYIVSESGKDGEDGENGKDGTNGASTMFNLSNDNGTFAYDYHKGDIIVNPKDNSTEIQYSEDSNYVCCTTLNIGGIDYSDSTSGVCDKVHFNLTKGTKYWILTVTSIDDDGDGDLNTYSAIFSLPIRGFVNDKEVGSATFKMTGVKDLNEDGVYLYRLITEHQHSPLKPHSGDYLDVQVFRDELVKGDGYSEKIPILVEAISKENSSTLGVISGTVSCATPAELQGDNLVSMETIQGQKGAIIKVYAKDPDYENRPEFSNEKYSSYSNQGYYYTGEYEEIAWTAPGGSTPEITQEQIAAAVKMIVCNNNNIIVAEGATYNFTFKDVSGNPKNVNISGIPTNIFTYETTTANRVTSLALTSKSDLSTVDPTSGEITYKDPSNPDIYGTIRYNWIGDQSHDGVYYTYDMTPSARVIGYDDDGTFTPKKIIVTCYCTEYGNGSKKIAAGTGYIGINNEKDISKLIHLESGQATITIGESGDYTGTSAFTIRWYAIDADLAAAGTGHAFEEGGKKYYMVDEQPIDIVPTKVIQAEAVTKNYKMVGQASRMRNYASLGTGTNYFYPTGYEMTASNGDNDNIYEGISDSGTTIYFPKYYDILSYYDGTTKTTTYYRCIGYHSVTGKPNLTDKTKWTSAQMEDFMAIDQLIANQIAATTVEADKLLVRTKKGEGTFEAGMINGYDTIEEKEVGDIRIFAGYGGATAPVTNAPFRVDKTGKMTSTNAEITGKVAATSFQVNTANNLESSDLDDKNGVMWITTWGKARQKGTSNSISLKIDGSDDTVPVIVVRKGGSFFVLNPLQLGNGQDIILGYFCYIKLNEIFISGNKLLVDPNFDLNSKLYLGQVKYLAKSNSLEFLSESGSALSTKSNISILSYGKSEHDAYTTAGNLVKIDIGVISQTTLPFYGYAFNKAEISSSAVSNSSEIYRIIGQDYNITYDDSKSNSKEVSEENFLYSGSGGYNTRSTSITVIKPEYSRYLVNLERNTKNRLAKTVTLVLNTTNAFSQILNKNIEINSLTELQIDNNASPEYRASLGYRAYYYVHNSGKPFSSGLEIDYSGESVSKPVSAENLDFVIIMLVSIYTDGSYSKLSISSERAKKLLKIAGLSTETICATLPDDSVTAITSEGITIKNIGTNKASLRYNNKLKDYEVVLTNECTTGGYAYYGTERGTIQIKSSSKDIIKEGTSGDVEIGLKVLNSLNSPSYTDTMTAHIVKQTCKADFVIYYGIGQTYSLQGAYINNPSLSGVERIIGKSKMNANNYSTFKPYRKFNIGGTEVYDDGHYPILKVSETTSSSRNITINQLIHGHFQTISGEFYSNIIEEV